MPNYVSKHHTATYSFLKSFHQKVWSSWLLAQIRILCFQFGLLGSHRVWVRVLRFLHKKAERVARLQQQQEKNIRVLCSNHTHGRNVFPLNDAIIWINLHYKTVMAFIYVNMFKPYTLHQFLRLFYQILFASSNWFKQHMNTYLSWKTGL